MTAPGDTGTAPLSLTALAPGQILPDQHEYISFAAICQLTATSGDWYPGHYDPDFARSQGQPTIFVSTLYFHGLIDKYVTDLLGPETFVARRRMRMHSSVYADAQLTVRGSVIGVDPAAGQATIAVELECNGKKPVTAEVTAELPIEGRAGAQR
jgi:acyl dehydratase